VWGKWRYSSTDVNLGTRWRNVVSFISVTIYPRRKGHRSWVRANGGFDAEEKRKSYFKCRESNRDFLVFLARSQTPLYFLRTEVVC